MKTNILTLMLWGLLSLHMQAADGDTFTANTTEGVEMAFMVISETDKTVQVGTGTSGYGQCAIDYETSGSVTIPSEVTYSNVTYSVVAIGKGGFGGCEKLISIDIPNSITLIDDWAFSGCIKLETIDIPNSVTSIGARVFECCEIITSITIPSSVTSIGVNLFNGCILLTSITVDSDNPIYDSRNHCNAIIETATNKLIAGCQNTTIPSSVTSIANVAFRNCINLTSIEIPSSVREIGIGAFKESGLTSIIFHEGLETIASEAFAQSSLTSITIPNSVTSIGGYHTSEEYVTLANGKQQKVTFTYRGCFDQCENLKTVTLGTGLTEISRGTFAISSVESVHFNTPTNIKEIAFEAFADCWKLDDVVIPEGVESIGRSAFVRNTALTSIKIPSTLTYFDVTALSGATSLQKIIVPSISQWCTMDYGNNCNVGEYNSYAAEGLLYDADLYLEEDTNTPVRDIVFPNGSTTIPQFAFYGASNLRSIEIPATVTSVPELSFYKCTSLEAVTLHEGLDFIGRNAFAYCDNLTNINLPNGLQTIQAAAFAFGKKLKTVIIPNSVTTAGNGDSSYAGIFQGSTGIESVTIGSGLTEIPQSMFDGCTNLQSVEFSEGLTSIGLGAFRGCTNLQSVVFPNSLTHISSDAFYYCTSLNTIIFPNNITSVDGGYNTSGGTHYPAFDGCDNLTQVIVPDFNIADWCGKSLAGGPLKYSHHIYDVNENDLLVDVVVPEGVTTIKKSAFEGCESMISLTFPSTLTSIKDCGFKDCSNLESVTCKMQEPALNINSSNYFAGISDECVLYVPAGTKDAYTAKGWTEDIFKGGIVELEEEEEPSQGENPVIEGTDVTEMLVNPDFSTNDWTGWTKEAAYGGNVAVAEECAEAWNNSAFDIYQEITNVPDGLYEISVQGFYRYGRGDNAWNYYQAQEAPEVREGGAPVFVYLNNMTTPFKNVFEEPEADGFYSSQYYMSPNEQYFPDGMTSAATAFGEGMFTQRAYGLVQNGEDMRIGVKGSSNQLNDSWVIFDNFKLTYHAQNPEVVDIVLQIKSEELGDFIDNNSESMTTSVLESVTTTYNQSTNSNLKDDEKYDVLIATNNALVVAKENVQIVMAYQTALEAYQSACTNLEQYDPNQEEDIWTDINSMNDEINSSDELDNEGLSDLISRMESLTYLVLEKVAYLQNPPIEIGGIYYNLDSYTQMATVVSGNTEYEGDVVIPESVEYDDVVYAVTAIGQEAFYDCDNLTSVVIPNSVISIGGYAFANCISMTSIDIPNSVTSIDAGAFNSTHLSSVTIPYGVTSIGHNTFSTCYLLTTVTIPGSVTFIDDYAFSHCSNLTDVYCYAEDVPETGYDIFASDEFYIVNLGNATLHVPAASIDDYQTTAPWSEFGSIVALDDEPADPDLTLVNTLTIANVEVENGNSVVLPVNLNNTESITAIQFEVALPTSNDKINVVYQSDFTEYGQDALPIGYSGVSDNSERQSTAAEPYSGGGAPRLMGSNDHANHGIYWGARGGSNGLLQFGKYAAESATGETLGDGITEDEALWLEEGDYTLNFRNAAWDDHASPYTVRICMPNTEAIFEETDIVPDVQLAHNGNTPDEDDIPVSEYEFTVTTPGYYYIEFEGNSGWLCWLLTSLSVSVKSDVQNEDPAGITISNCQLTDRKGTYHTASYEQLVNGNYQITVSSPSDDVFSGTEGVVVNLTLDVDEDMPAGVYPVRLTNIELTTDAAQTIQPADASATLTVVNGAEEPVEPVEENNTLVMENLSGRTGTQFLLPVGLLNEDDITALQFNITLPDGVSIAKNSKDKYIVEKTERCEDHTLSASKPGDANVYTVLLYSNDVESITGTDGTVLNVRLEVSEDMEAGDYEVSLSNINLTTVDEVKITPADVTCTLTVTNSIPGDANGDGSIDVTDIVGIANCILGNASNSFDATAADINGDGDVDVTDIVAVANIILHSGGQNNAKMREVLDMIKNAPEPQ